MTAVARSPHVGTGVRRRTLATEFSPRANSLAVLRLAFAGVVAVAHGLALGADWQPALGRTKVADLAVDGFFVVSGFLVTRSCLRLGSPARFAWHRFLRLMPGFWMCLVVTAVVAAPLAAVLVGRDPASVFTADEEPAWRYVLVNAALPIPQFGIAGITSPGGEDVFDGALWTLQYEAACYVVVGVLGATAVLQRRPAWVLALCAGVWGASLLQHGGLLPFDVPVLANAELLRFLLVFLLAAAAFLYADRVPLGTPWIVGSAVVTVASCWLPDYRVIGAVTFVHLVLAAVARLPVRWEPRWDLSYGLYLYHWPVQFLMLLGGVAALGSAAFVALSICVALLVAVLSWTLVERVALRAKDLGRDRTGDHAARS